MISDYGRHEYSVSKIIPNSRETANASAMPAYSSAPMADQKIYQSMQFDSANDQ